MAQPADTPSGAAPSVDRAAAAAPATDGAGAHGVAGDPYMTAGEQAMVTLAGGTQADPAIRRTIAEENQALADVEASLFTRIVDWRKPSTQIANLVSRFGMAQSRNPLIL